MSKYDLNANMAAFLDMLAYSEGTKGVGDDGYNVIVGSTKANPILFTNYDDHPRKLVFLPSIGKSSTAAGRYQLLARYFDYYKKELGLKNFSPLAQDLIAIEQIKEQGAYVNVLSGNFVESIEKCKNIWASLPGNDYGQHQNKLADLLTAYESFGGKEKLS